MGRLVVKFMKDFLGWAWRESGHVELSVLRSQGACPLKPELVLLLGLLPAKTGMRDGWELPTLFPILGAWLFLGHRYLIFFIPLLFSFLTPKSYSSQFTISAVRFGFRSVICTLEASECACFLKHRGVEGAVCVIPTTAPLVWPPRVQKKHQPHITPPRKEILGGWIPTRFYVFEHRCI